jgi:uncharacterized protein (DUF2141 family)
MKGPGIPGVLEFAQSHRTERTATNVPQRTTRDCRSGWSPMGVRCVAVLTVLVFANLPAGAFAQPPCPGIHVQILNIRNSTGTVACTLFESPEGFPIEFLRSATNVMVIKIRKSQARCDFEDIPPGTYAMAVVHDENMNGKLETNWLGMPTEGYGFSNDATGVVGAPSFAAASFQYDGRNLDVTMRLHY